MIINLQSPVIIKRSAAPAVKQKRMPMDEQSWSALLQAWEKDWTTYTENPDKVLAQRHWSFYKEIVCDDTVHSCLEIKKTARLSTDWYIEPYSDNLDDMRVARFIDYNFTHMRGTFKKLIKDIYSAFEFGFSVSELNWVLFEAGEWKGLIGLKSIKTRDPEWLHFVTDKHGNIEEIKQEGTWVSSGYINIPRDKVIVYTAKPRFWNPHGRADCLFVYKPYIAKLWTVRFWNVALEKFGMPSLIGKYPPGTGKPQRDYLRKVLDNLQVSPAITLPSDVEVDTITAVAGGNMAYEKALDSHNTAMARALLIPDLLGFSKFTKGSYALGKKHFDIFLMVLDEIGRDTEEDIVDEQIIKPLVKYNFNTENIPHFKFKSMVEEDKFKIAKSWSELVHAQVVTKQPLDEDHLRREFGFPVEERKEKAFSFAVAKPIIKTRAHAVVRFAEIKKTWDDLEEQTMNDLYAVGEKMQADLMKKIENKGLLGDKVTAKDIDELNKIKYVGDFKKALEKGLILAHLNSKHSAMQELKLLGVELPVRFSELEATMDLFPVEAIAFFKGKIPMTRTELSFYTRKAFQIAGVQRDVILAKAQNILYRHMTDKKKNKALTSFRKLFDRYIKTGELKISIRHNYELLSGYHVENIVRTNIAEAMGEGRRAMYEDPLVRDEIVGYTPSGILDDRQTDYCRSIDGRVFPKEGYTFEPYHYLCRTQTLPVMKGETYIYTEWKESPYEGF